MSETSNVSPPAPYLVVSDVHIGAVPPETEEAFRAFLDYAVTESSALVINGDLFDIWVPSRRFVMRRYTRVIAKLAEVVEDGLPVYFVGGNHDAHEYGGDVLREDAGIKLLDDPCEVQMGRHRALLIHGDGVHRRSDGYRKEHPLLRSLLRNDRVRALAEKAFDVDWLYDRVSPISRVPRIVARQARGEGTGPKPLAPRIEQWARERLIATPGIDLVFAGHSHLPAWVEVQPGRYYVNTGDWIEHMTFCEVPLDGGPPQLRRWPGLETVLPATH